jgi:hypothetical protein
MKLVDYAINTPYNTNKTILKQLVNNEKNKAVYESVEELKKSGGVGYIEEEIKKVEVFPKTTLDFGDADENAYVNIQPLSLTDGKEYTVVFDGVEYKCIAVVHDVLEEEGLGNASLNESGPDTGEPFFYDRFEDLYCNIYSKTGGAHTIEIYYIEETETIHTIDPKFIPDTIARVSDVEAAQSAAKAYTDSQRLAYEEVSREVVLPETAGVPDVMGDGDTIYCYKRDIPFGKQFIVNQEYTVLFNGVEYKLKPEQSGLGDYLIPYGVGTGKYPFFISSGGGTHATLYSVDGGENSFAVYQQSEVIHPIDPKFVPVMDSITLNGADGKQYKVSVNASGALVAEAIG